MSEMVSIYVGYIMISILSIGIFKIPMGFGEYDIFNELGRKW